MINILGGGLSGLSAAINLAKEGEAVTVYEKRNDIGGQIKPNYQAVSKIGDNINKYLNSLNLNPDFDVTLISKAYICTRKRDIFVSLAESSALVLRGGKTSLEYGLYKEAKSLGVKFEFNSNKKENEVDIVAIGPKWCDAVAFGAVYENLNFEKDCFLNMYDERFSPTGWYLYIVPFPDGKFEVINCVSQPYVSQVKKLFFAAIKEREILKEIIGENKPIHYFGGFGGVAMPKSAVVCGRIYIGESAGFQDSFRGFGIKYALESGYLAAKSIVHNKDYDKLWKKRFKKELKKSFSRRFAITLLKDKLPEFYFRNIKDNDVVDFRKETPKGIVIDVLEELCYRLEFVRKRVTGHW